MQRTAKYLQFRPAWLGRALALCLLLGLTSAPLHSQQAAASGSIVQTATPTQGSTAFLYQGELSDNGTPATGNYHFKFLLMADASEGTELGRVEAAAVPVTSGGFAVILDFGQAPFTGEDRWLEIQVKGPGAGQFTTLSPRQPLLPMPYALHAHSAQAVAWSGISDIPADFADGVDQTSNFSAGEGLRLDGDTLAINFDGDGGATTAARSDHTHLGAQWSGSTYNGLLVETSALDGNGIFGRSTAATGYSDGVVGETYSPSGHAVYGYSYAMEGDPVAILGATNAPQGVGVQGSAWSDTGGNNAGVVGYTGSTEGHGVEGYNGATEGYAIGIHGSSSAWDGIGMSGYAWETGGDSAGVVGVVYSPNGEGVYGENATENGDYAYGVYGISFSTTGRGVEGMAITNSGTNFGVSGYTNSPKGYGVFGRNQAQSGTPAVGVFALSDSPNGTGLYATNNAGGDAARFDGNVTVNGRITKSAGSFRIDHPLDPEHKYLSHSFVESPDMMNIYNGNVVLDGNGEGWVLLPEWFEALNREFRYQLTPIGAPAPNLYIAEEIQGNRFKIGGGGANLKVSWQVTGIRHDPYAEANRIQVEEWKSVDVLGERPAAPEQPAPTQQGAKGPGFQPEPAIVAEQRP